MLLEPRVGVVTPCHGLNVVTLGIKVVAKQRGQRFFVLDHKNTGAHFQSFI